MIKQVIFTSSRESQLWLWALVVLISIFTTLFFGGRLIEFMVERRMIEQGTFYLFLLLVATFMISGWKTSNRRLEYWIYAGVLAVIGMTLFRLDITAAERSHMFEYGLLAVLIFEALRERKDNGAMIKIPALIAFFCAGTIGLLDECIQYFMPFRVFDFVDIGFNFLASAIGIIMNISVKWLQGFFSKLFKKKV